MKHPVFLLFCISTLLMTTAVSALPVLKEPKRARMIADLNINRDDGRTLYRQVLLFTCSFAINGEKRSCKSRPIQKKIESIAIDVGKANEDTVSLGIINDPPSEKNMAFLQKDYDEEGKESDQWMYFPALKKLKRIVSQSADSPKTGSVFGSEIQYEDIEKRHLTNYRFSYEGVEDVDGRPCDKIIAYPTQTFQPKTSYVREELWIDQETKIDLKRNLYNKQRQLAKTFLKKEIVNRSGIWINKIMIVVNHPSRCMSMEKTTKLAVNIPIDPDVVGQRALKDASFRENALDKIRHLAR